MANANKIAIVSSSMDMLSWQRRTLLGQLDQIQLHAESGDCPCIMKDLDPPEFCLAKHCLSVSTISAETAAMDKDNSKMLQDLSDEAAEMHEKVKDFMCHKADLPDLVPWARAWRKKLEKIYYSTSCKVKLKQEMTCTLNQSIKVGCTQKATMRDMFYVKMGVSISEKGEFVVLPAWVDTGGTISSIPDELAKQLKLKRLVGHHYETITGFGGGLKRPVYECYLRVKGRVASTLVWGVSEATATLGAQALELLGFKVNPLAKELEVIHGRSGLGLTSDKVDEYSKIFKYERHVALNQDPKLKISGQCTASSCSIKVKGVVETVETSTAAGLPEAINTVIRHMEKRAAGAKVSPLTYAIGPTSLTRYELKYKIVEAEKLVTSHNPFTFAINEAYPQELQPRLRGRAANKAQVMTMASHLDPDSLLDDYHSIDRGAPIVNSENIVLSGNGRVMAIQNAIKDHPASYENYASHLKTAADNYGLKVAKITNPVLVRELVTKVDMRTFVEEANASTTIAPSAVEVARADALKITPAMLNGLDVPEGLSIEDALRSRSNAGFVSAFLEKLSANERGSISDSQGNLSQDGIRRITMAVFLNVFPGDVGLRISEKFFEATDPNIRNTFNGIVGALGKLAQSEALIKSGTRAAGLAISEDLAQAVSVYSEIKKTPGFTVEKYLNQSQLFERQLSPFQEKLLTAIDKRSRSGKKVARHRDRFASTWPGFDDTGPRVD
jgi:predicted aspartyl protease